MKFAVGTDTGAKAQFLCHPVRPAEAGRFHGELKA
jgi:hypothetical protein